MQEQFKNIFVTLEVAKMAKEKGFNEICAGYFDMSSFAKFVLPNSNTSHTFILDACDNQGDYIEAPTHFQLTQWLISSHKIHVSQQATEIWMIAYDLPCGRFGKIYKNKINDALLEALKLVKHE